MTSGLQVKILIGWIPFLNLNGLGEKLQTIIIVVSFVNKL